MQKEAFAGFQRAFARRSKKWVCEWMGMGMGARERFISGTCGGGFG